jgi:hypothetical protein
MAKYRVIRKCEDLFVHDVEANNESEARNKSKKLLDDGDIGLEINGDLYIDEVVKIED